MNPNDPFSSSGERLALLYQLSQTFNSSLDLNEVLNRVMDEVITAVKAERGFVMLREAASANHEEKLVFKAARGMDQKTIEDPQFQISRSIVERVAHDAQPVLSSDAQTDSRFNLRQSVMILGLRSILCVPLRVKDKVMGVIYVDNRLQAGIFTQADLQLLNAIASSAAIAIENARLYQVAVEKGRIERELQMARKVQSGLLPQTTPQVSGWDFAARWRPAREVGGDYYDFINLDGGKVGTVIADVTDKGMPAALFMASTRSIIRASVNRAVSPVEGINHANYLISDESEDTLFVTLFYAQLAPANGEVVYVNAGHNPALVYHTGADQLELLTTTGMPLGVDAGVDYKQRMLRLDPGDFILFYTDGVPDAIDLQENEFGMERLRQVVYANRLAHADEIITNLERAVTEFTGAAVPFDDITLVVMQREIGF